MSVEINIRKKEDKLETNNLLEMFLQQIEMVMSTRKTSVLGATDMGVSFEYYLHTFKTNKSELQQIIKQQIDDYCNLAGRFSYEIFVDFYKMEFSDALIVDIVVERENTVRVVVD